MAKKYSFSGRQQIVARFKPGRWWENLVSGIERNVPFLSSLHPFL
jgi:hypothetical protein